MISHRSLASHCDLVRRHYQISCEDRVLQFADCTADVSVEQIFTTLIAVATLILRDNDLWPVEVFQRKIAELNLSVIDLPSAYFHQWALEEAGRVQPEPSHRPRLVIVGGDVLSAEHASLWQSQIPRKSFC